MKLNENKISKAVSEVEGGVVNQPIAQIKETQKAFLDHVANSYPMSAIIEMIERHIKK